MNRNLSIIINKSNFTFHFRIRSQIRIQDERAKPIDLLAQYVSSEGDVTAVDMHEPYTHLTGLTLHDLEDLLEDIKVYQQLEKEVRDIDFFQLVIVDFFWKIVLSIYTISALVSYTQKLLKMLQKINNNLDLWVDLEEVVED